MKNHIKLDLSIVIITSFVHADESLWVFAKGANEFKMSIISSNSKDS